MSADEKGQTTTDSSDDEQPASDTPEFELSEEGKEEVRKMRSAYDDDRPTAVLPGTDGTITGVAVNEWLDEDGNPKFGQDKQQEDADGNPKSGQDKQQEDEDGNPKFGQDKQQEDAD